MIILNSTLWVIDIYQHGHANMKKISVLLKLLIILKEYIKQFGLFKKRNKYTSLINGVRCVIGLQEMFKRLLERMRNTWQQRQAVKVILIMIYQSFCLYIKGTKNVYIFSENKNSIRIVILNTWGELSMYYFSKVELNCDHFKTAILVLKCA